MSLTNDVKLNAEPPFYGGSFFFCEILQNLLTKVSFSIKM